MGLFVREIVVDQEGYENVGGAGLFAGWALLSPIAGARPQFRGRVVTVDEL